MESPSLFSVLKLIFLDWRVLTAFAVVLLYLNFIFYIARYRKKPKILAKARIKRVSKPVADENDSDEGDAKNEDSGGTE